MVGRLTLIGVAVLYLVLTVESATPESWVGFYQSQTPRVSSTAAQDSQVCKRAILRAQQKYAIPDNLLLAIGIQEAGRKVDGELTIWPWTANAHGRGAFFDSKAALEDWVRKTQSKGTQSIDVGCMQINQRWHAQKFASLSEATEPTANVDYAARFLTALYHETRDWREAAGRYHSSTPALKDIYLRKLTHNHKLANGSFALAGADAPAPVTPRAQPSFHWSADMTGTGARKMRQVVSIYSPTPLQPILPNYERVD